jgi:hypothetical protein
MPRSCLAVAPAAALVALVLAAPAPAFVHSCSPRFHVRDRLAAIATITSVRNVTCRRALGVVRRNGRRAGNKAFGPTGSRFRLGKWRCTVTFRLEEDHKARCVRGRAAFRVDYGS